MRMNKFCQLLVLKPYENSSLNIKLGIISNAYTYNLISRSMRKTTKPINWLFNNNIRERY